MVNEGKEERGSPWTLCPHSDTYSGAITDKAWRCMRKWILSLSPNTDHQTLAPDSDWCRGAPMSALLQELHCWTHMTMVLILVHQQNSSSMSGGPLDPCLAPHKDNLSHWMWDLCPTPPLCPAFNPPVGNSSASTLSHSHHWSPYLTCRTEWDPTVTPVGLGALPSLREPAFGVYSAPS